LKRCVVYLFLILTFIFIDKAYSWEWKTYTSMLNVTSMCGVDSLLWCGTEGGLFAFNKGTGTFSTWTNTEGLAYNFVTAVTYDEEGRIWIGFENGLIQRYDPVRSDWLLVREYINHRVENLALTGDTLFVGLDIGVSLYLVSGQEVKETYRHLGQKFHVEISVHDIQFAGRKIWVATDEGVACASLDSPNLLDPESWEDFTATDGLPCNEVKSLVFFDDKIYAGTSEGISEWNGTEWVLINTSGIFDLAIHKEQLYAATENGVFYKSGSKWFPLGHSLNPILHLSSVSSILWGGTGKGICSYSEEKGEWENFIPNTPGDNRFIDLAIDKKGTLWCCSANYHGTGFSSFDGFNWRIFNHSVLPQLPSNNVASVCVDANNNKWIGTWGSGLFFMRSDSLFNVYDVKSGHLAGISEDPNYAVITDMVLDNSGTLWILNYRAVTNYPLIAVTPDSVWTCYGAGDGISTSGLVVIAVDSKNRKWIGSSDPNARGVFILDDSNTPADKGDDPPVQRLTTSDGLRSNKITALAGDKAGGMWIGTPSGLYYYFAGELKRRYGLPSENVTALAVDGAGNVWVGTIEGLAMFSAETFSWTYYSTDNSDLVSNDVQSIVIDPVSGKIYVGTEQGLSCIKTPFSEPKLNLNELTIYPNPFVPEQDNKLTIDNLAYHVSVYIFSSSGFLVRAFRQNEIHGKQIFWDGTDSEGRYVAGGIYLIVVQTEGGEKRIGKVALVR